MKFSIQTLGCKVNHYESEQMAAMLRSRGWKESAPEEASLRIIHTCSVTTEAASKSRSAVRRMVKLPVLGKTVVSGCWATGDCHAAGAIPGVDAVMTNKEEFAARMDDLLAKWNFPRQVHLPQFEQPRQHRQRAFLKIQDGCDAHCTYCIIPSLRPRLDSKPVDEVVKEANLLVNSGYREIILTGIFISAYGRPTALRRRQTRSVHPLAELVEAVCTRVPELGRLRISSLEPGDMDDSLMDVLASHPQVMPHFHLPLQSGSDRILRRMNRQYRRDEFMRMTDRLHARFDRPALTTDIIAGFPGETDSDFDQTMDVARRAGFIHIHAFPFSPRPGTAAARWGNDFIHGSVVRGRINRLTELASAASLKFRRQFIGQTVEVIVESEMLDEGRRRHGRCERYFDVEFAAAANRPGDLIPIQIEQVDEARTFGSIVSIRADAVAALST